MNTLTLLTGALAFRDSVFQWLREQSDAFLRGLAVLLLVGLVAGAFDAALGLLSRARATSESAEQITQDVMQQISADPQYRALIETYVREGVGIALDINRLPPRAGAALAPLARLGDWVGQTLSSPLSFAFLGMFLLTALAVQLTSRWLGGQATMVQTLGLTALASAPRLFNPISSLLVFLGGGAATGALGSLNALVGWVLFIWSAAILVQANSIAQRFSIARSLGAVLLALLLAVVVLIASAVLVAALIAGLIAAVVSALQ